MPGYEAPWIDEIRRRLEGMTSNLRRPGGNLTGVSWQSTETAAKRLELAKELLPGLERAALLTDRTDAGPVVEAKGFRTAAATLKVALEVFELGHARDFPAAFAAIKRYRPQALMITTNGLMIENSSRTSKRLCALHRVSGFQPSAKRYPSRRRASC